MSRHSSGASRRARSRGRTTKSTRPRRYPRDIPVVSSSLYDRINIPVTNANETRSFGTPEILKQLTPAFEDAIYNLLRKGFTFGDLVHLFKVDRYTLRNVFERLNLNIIIQRSNRSFEHQQYLAERATLENTTLHDSTTRLRATAAQFQTDYNANGRDTTNTVRAIPIQVDSDRSRSNPSIASDALQLPSGPSKEKLYRNINDLRIPPANMNRTTVNATTKSDKNENPSNGAAIICESETNNTLDTTTQKGTLQISEVVNSSKAIPEEANILQQKSSSEEATDLSVSDPSLKQSIEVTKPTVSETIDSTIPKVTGSTIPEVTEPTLIGSIAPLEIAEPIILDQAGSVIPEQTPQLSTLQQLPRQYKVAKQFTANVSEMGQQELTQGTLNISLGKAEKADNKNATNTIMSITDADKITNEGTLITTDSAPVTTGVNTSFQRPTEHTPIQEIFAPSIEDSTRKEVPEVPTIHARAEGTSVSPIEKTSIEQRPSIHTASIFIEEAPVHPTVNTSVEETSIPLASSSAEEAKLALPSENVKVEALYSFSAEHSTPEEVYTPPVLNNTEEEVPRTPTGALHQNIDDHTSTSVVEDNDEDINIYPDLSPKEVKSNRFVDVLLEKSEDVPQLKAKNMKIETENLIANSSSELMNATHSATFLAPDDPHNQLLKAPTYPATTVESEDTEVQLEGEPEDTHMGQELVGLMTVQEPKNLKLSNNPRDIMLEQDQEISEPYQSSDDIEPVQNIERLEPYQSSDNTEEVAFLSDNNNLIESPSMKSLDTSGIDTPPGNNVDSVHGAIPKGSHFRFLKTEEPSNLNAIQLDNNSPTTVFTEDKDEGTGKNQDLQTEIKSVIDANDPDRIKFFNTANAVQQNMQNAIKQLSPLWAQNKQHVNFFSTRSDFKQFINRFRKSARDIQAFCNILDYDYAHLHKETNPKPTVLTGVSPKPSNHIVPQNSQIVKVGSTNDAKHKTERIKKSTVKDIPVKNIKSNPAKSGRCSVFDISGIFNEPSAKKRVSHTEIDRQSGTSNTKPTSHKPDSSNKKGKEGVRGDTTTKNIPNTIHGDINEPKKSKVNNNANNGRKPSLTKETKGTENLKNSKDVPTNTPSVQKNPNNIPIDKNSKLPGFSQGSDGNMRTNSQNFPEAIFEKNTSKATGSHSNGSIGNESTMYHNNPLLRNKHNPSNVSNSVPLPIGPGRLPGLTPRPTGRYSPNRRTANSIRDNKRRTQPLTFPSSYPPQQNATNLGTRSPEKNNLKTLPGSAQHNDYYNNLNLPSGPSRKVPEPQIHSRRSLPINSMTQSPLKRTFNGPQGTVEENDTSTLSKRPHLDHAPVPQHEWDNKDESKIVDNSFIQLSKVCIR
ncbi:hypothetical protein, no similarity [Maudiozyma saulgeensis]|uniref:Uncharacterized protein n=1 Tax=Maudiozyma saulgeensis TaxID=1789683 RepID=A0A1X7R4Y3_9SACH|nr:hypothetical protein, no similarity [Kazachstania saulgeensis]